MHITKCHACLSGSIDYKCDDDRTHICFHFDISQTAMLLLLLLSHGKPGKCY